MSRIAWFTPLPPLTSGVARYSAELIPRLTSHDIHVFIDGSPARVAAPDPRVPVRSAHDFVWMHARAPFDLVVYQLGNAPCHDYMWGYLAHYPGLVVLHDGQLHHARALSLRAQHREDDYREEFRLNHPGVPPDAAELAIAGWLGSLTYLWPMRRLVIDASRAVLVHNQWLGDEIREEHPSASVHVVEMGVPSLGQAGQAGRAGQAGGGAPRAVRKAVRARHGMPDGAVVFLVLGTATPEKRIRQVIRALAGVADARLLIVGQNVGHYDPEADARAHGVADRVIVTGHVPHEDLADYLSASDVCVCLRWPTSRETSAVWLRCLAAGRATVITDLAHTVDIPALDPRNWKVAHAPPAIERETLEPLPVSPVAVCIDILDEDHSLLLALRRLGQDRGLRETLGNNARALWQSRFTLDRMTAGYERVISEAIGTSMPNTPALAAIPEHLRTDGTERAVALLRTMHVSEPRIRSLWRTGETSHA